MSKLSKRSLFDLDAFLDDGFNLISVPRAGWDLAADISQDNSNVIVEMHMPGIEPDKIDIAVEGNVLHVCGEREETVESKDHRYHSKEIKRGSFERVLNLPVEVQGDAARAESKDGVLRILLPKKEVAKATKIKVSGV